MSPHPKFTPDPYAAMVHHNQQCQGYANQLDTRNAPPLHQQAMGDPWPWEMRGTELLDMQLREAQKARAALPKPEAQHFDNEAHRNFMRGLG